METFILFWFTGFIASMFGEGDLQCSSLMEREIRLKGYQVMNPVFPALGGFGVLVAQEGHEIGRKTVILFTNPVEKDYVLESIRVKPEGVIAEDLGICHSKGHTAYAIQVLVPGQVVFGQGA
jgi:hypothetical protein